MKALLFGSIGAIVETSELQRRAYNEVFRDYGLDWSWDQKTYRSMLSVSGGTSRIAAYARQTRTEVDARSLNRAKRTRFQDLLRNAPLALRPGVGESIALARQLGVVTGLVSTTDRETIDIITLRAPTNPAPMFDLILSESDQLQQKPDPEPFRVACEKIGIAPGAALAVEDNAPGIASAQAAGCRVVAFLGANTQGHSTADADWSAKSDLYPVVLGALSAAVARAA